VVCFAIFEQHTKDIVACSHRKLEIIGYEQGILAFTHKFADLGNHIGAIFFSCRCTWLSNKTSPDKFASNLLLDIFVHEALPSSLDS